jgi:hypothetical protein
MGAIRRHKYEARSLEILDTDFMAEEDDRKSKPSLRQICQNIIKHAKKIEDSYIKEFKEPPTDELPIIITMSEIRQLEEALV